MNAESTDPRIEKAWQRLHTWARGWHRTAGTKYFVGSLGSASLTQVCFSNVYAGPVGNLLSANKAEIRIVKKGKHETQVSKLAVPDVSGFLTTCKEETDGTCFILAEGKAALTGGVFEHDIIIERSAGVTADVDVTITWVPLLAFLKSPDVRERFLAIFGWFFSVQRMLRAERVLLCLERCPHSRNDPSAWMEI